jgi:hypothetical protein
VLRSKRNILSVARTGLKLQNKKGVTEREGQGDRVLPVCETQRGRPRRLGASGPGVDDDGAVGGGDDGKDDGVPEATQARNGFTCQQQSIGGRGGEGDGSTAEGGDEAGSTAVAAARGGWAQPDE